MRSSRRSTTSSPGRRPTLDRKTFAAEFGARRDDIAAVRRFAKANGFRVKT